MARETRPHARSFRLPEGDKEERAIEQARVNKLYPYARDTRSNECMQVAWAAIGAFGTSWMCTRERGHTGMHVAHGAGGRALGYWQVDQEAVPDPRD